MKKLLLLPVLLISTLVASQELQGAWQLTELNGLEVNDMETIILFQDDYFAVGSKEKETNKFHSARGGEFRVDGQNFIEIHDFDTENPEFVGKEINSTISWDGESITISEPGHSKVYQKLSDKSDDLTRNWVFTGRQRDGEMSTTVPGDRRTVKILTGGRFQWIAFNSATTQFSGTGGGTYTVENGKYTENIEFFSRDDSRVGASLEFDYEIKDGKWHHSGESSKGDPIYEIWSPYQEAYSKNKGSQ